MAKKSKESTTFGLLKIFSENVRGNRSLRSVLWALIAVGIVGGIVGGLLYMDRRIQKLEVFTGSEVSVCLHDQPKWMSESLAREILIDSFKPIHSRLVQIHREGKDSTLDDVLAGQFSKNPWVRTVHWVRRGLGGQFVINADFRQPTAIVSIGKWSYMVDDYAYLLPGKYKFDALKTCGMIEIRGVEGEAPAAGKLWSSEDLQAGLKLVKLLLKVPFKDKISAVDVSNFRAREDQASCWITLVTDRDTTVRWGKPVDEERGLENSAAQKLALLASVYQQTGHIDTGKQIVDVRRSPTHIDRSIAAVEQVQE